MSNKTRLQTNNTNLQSLIDKANALPEAGSSSGGSLETCTVTIYGNGGSWGYCATTYENGSVAVKYEIPDTRNPTNPLVLTNVICGSVISFNNGVSIVKPAFTVTNGIEVLEGRYVLNRNRDYYIKAPTEPGVSASLTFIDND